MTRARTVLVTPTRAAAARAASATMRPSSASRCGCVAVEVLIAGIMPLLLQFVNIFLALTINSLYVGKKRPPLPGAPGLARWADQQQVSKRRQARSRAAL